MNANRILMTQHLIRQTSMRSWRLSAAAALAGLLALSPIAVRIADGQTSLLQITALAQGASPDHNLNLHVQGPSDILQSLLTFQPGGDTGWHTHPGRYEGDVGLNNLAGLIHGPMHLVLRLEERRAGGMDRRATV